MRSKEIRDKISKSMLGKKNCLGTKQSVERIKGLEIVPHKHGTDCKSYHDCEKFTFFERNNNSAIKEVLSTLQELKSEIR